VPQPCRDGTSSLIFEPLDFLAKLAALVPPPRSHQIRFHGVYAPHARLRSAVTPAPAVKRGVCDHIDATESGAVTSKTRRLGWAKCMARVFSVDVEECPRCGSRLQRIAMITEHRVVRAILASVGLPADSPVPAPSRFAAQGEFTFEAA
jgi:hypothetical protein